MQGRSDVDRHGRGRDVVVGSDVDRHGRVGVSWLEANASEVVWTGMTVSKLCITVSGWSFQEYLAKMRRGREWVDMAFLHAFGRAYGVNVWIFQAHIDETLVGEDLAASTGHDHHTAIVVPVALVNDQHVWGGVLPCADVDAIGPVDKGDHRALWSQGVRAYVLTRHIGGARAYVLARVVVTTTPLKTPMASMMGSRQM